MTLETRVLSRSDRDVLKSLGPGVFDDAIDWRATEEFLADDRHHLVVAIDGGLVVGFVSAVHYVHPDKPGPELWVNEVSVASSHRQRGVGRAIMERMLSLARDLHCTTAWVLTDRDNSAAMRLYESVGGIEAPKPAVMFEYDLGRNPG